MTIHQVPLRFIQVGFGNGVCANQILAVLAPSSAPNQRLLAAARQENRFMDTTCGRGVRSLLVMLDGRVIGTAVKPATMLRRLNAPECEEPTDDREGVEA